MTFTTKTTFAALAFIAASAATQATAAGNAGASMAACADHVVSACNANSRHPEACTSAGLSACKELHGNRSKPTPAISRIRIIERPDGTYRVVLEGVPLPRPGGNDDDKHRDPTPRDSVRDSAADTISH